eukprot:TRINITY_DN4881_c0_g2_i6.p1 TRINITY_DN4881_c0_g2~~TRINITY_DN4881_c0_g2_i6.p1  ORF type:complete len:112 (+),score=0.02 TRINITY_DN4881_c0_g2_i6:143-478(+)
MPTQSTRFARHDKTHHSPSIILSTDHIITDHNCVLVLVLMAVLAQPRHNHERLSLLAPTLRIAPLPRLLDSVRPLPLPLDIVRPQPRGRRHIGRGRGRGHGPHVLCVDTTA